MGMVPIITRSFVVLPELETMPIMMAIMMKMRMTNDVGDNNSDDDPSDDHSDVIVTTMMIIHLRANIIKTIYHNIDNVTSYLSFLP